MHIHRRSQLLLVAAGSAVFGALLVAAISPRPTSANLAQGASTWTMWGHAATHNAVFGSAGDPSNWTYTTSGSIVDQVSIVNGVTFAGTNSDQVVAVRGGRQLWSTKLPNEVMTTPLVDGGLVIVGLGNNAFQATTPLTRGTGTNGIWALDATTGQVVWHYRTLGEAMPTPAIRHGIVYEATGDRHLYALNLQTGRLLFKLNLGSYASMSSLAISGHMLVVGTANPYDLLAVNVAKRAIAWRHPLPQVTSGLDDCSPALSQGRVFIEGTQVRKGQLHEYLYAFEEATGRLLWIRDLGAGYSPPDRERTGSPTVAANVVYVGSPVTSSVYAVDASSGKLLWARAVGEQIRANPDVAYGKVVVVGSKGMVVTLSAATGQLVSNVQLSHKRTGASKFGFGASAPVIANGTFFVADMAGRIYARPVGTFDL